MAWLVQEDVHQKRKKVSKPFFLRPKRNYQNHREVPRDQYPHQDLSQRSEWAICAEKLPPSKPWEQELEIHTVQGQFCICSCNKETNERMTIFAVVGLGHLRKKRQLGRKHLFRTAEMVGKNILLS